MGGSGFGGSGLGCSGFGSSGFGSSGFAGSGFGCSGRGCSGFGVTGTAIQTSTNDQHLTVAPRGGNCRSTVPGTLIRFLIDDVTKAQFRSLELRFDRRLQVLDQVRHTTITIGGVGGGGGGTAIQTSTADPHLTSAPRERDLPDHGAFAVRRLLIADPTEAQLRSLELRSDFLTPIFKQVWHPTWLDVTLGLLIDFRRHRDPDVNVGPASGFCSRSRRLLENGPASMPIRLDLLDASERQAIPFQVTPGARSVGEFRDDADRDVLGRLWNRRRPLGNPAHRFNGFGRRFALRALARSRRSLGGGGGALRGRRLGGARSVRSGSRLRNRVDQKSAPGRNQKEHPDRRRQPTTRCMHGPGPLKQRHCSECRMLPDATSRRAEGSMLVMAEPEAQLLRLMARRTRSSQSYRTPSRRRPARADRSSTSSARRTGHGSRVQRSAD